MLLELKPNDEEGRLRALERYDVLDTREEVPFEKVIELVQQVFTVPMCAVSLVDRHRQWFKARRGLDVCETARDISFCTHAIKKSEPLIVPDALLDDRFANNPLVVGAPHIRSYAGVPLCTPDGYNIGSLCAIDTVPREFTHTQITILTSFAKLIVDELELRQIASIDHLTGALSRRAFGEHAKNEVARARRYGRPLAIAMIDIDHFKNVNDTHGHPVGDIVIKAIAEEGMLVKRESDIFGRIGGEEFAFLLPETDVTGAYVLCERLRSNIDMMEIVFLNEGTSKSIKVTVSIGIAELISSDADFDAMIERADKALYHAKRHGRNQTIDSATGPR